MFEKSIVHQDTAADNAQWFKTFMSLSADFQR